MNNYGIREGYRHREVPVHWDDRSMRDEWQREVYLAAKVVADVGDLRSILDVGCGSGFKLRTYFEDRVTTGVEVEPCLSYLRSTYKTHRWLSPDDLGEEKFDLVICADVIEHVTDPDTLCEMIRRHARSTVVISTPDRDLYPPEVWHQCHDGPPFNESHVREWNFQEFDSYMRHHFRVKSHIVTNRAQTTQMVVAEV